MLRGGPPQSPPEAAQTAAAPRDALSLPVAATFAPERGVTAGAAGRVPCWFNPRLAWHGRRVRCRVRLRDGVAPQLPIAADPAAALISTAVPAAVPAAVLAAAVLAAAVRSVAIAALAGGGALPVRVRRCPSGPRHPNRPNRQLRLRVHHQPERGRRWQRLPGTAPASWSRAAAWMAARARPAQLRALASREWALPPHARSLRGFCVRPCAAQVPVRRQLQQRLHYVQLPGG